MKCAVFEKTITSGSEDHAAMAQISGSADSDDPNQNMIDQGSTMSKSDILAVAKGPPSVRRSRA